MGEILPEIVIRPCRVDDAQALIPIPEAKSWRRTQVQAFRGVCAWPKRPVRSAKGSSGSVCCCAAATRTR